ncbi:Gfo/Idh/MocA family protein [Arcticibacterium luteifluviistationis]|uniref:Gfo/Idh/MocA family oxidoreductase n=1 Tax=Arcticibacterium luteifluviistationis TaxID=1784714 RepID=A0A2Z4GEC3_9BACT|nr:Gfo/Idh/MocA family oxidoreductase [Arcticibacterium luteifluviistationis]AWV99662.1 gfo/Idh/MocA family oxidoreductase [Arcticibacterium luteifluviistationis]
MSKTINWGIIGIGKIAEKFASDLATVENAKLVAVASRSIDRAKEFGGRHDSTFAYGSYEEIFNTPDLDAIYIATPHTSHAECTKLCLNKGVAVLCEKPFAMNEQEVKEMIHLAEEKQTFLMEALWTRFLPSTKKVLEIIDSKALGDIKLLQADFGFIPPFFPERRVLNPEYGGGAFLDIGIYPAFLSLLILGYPSTILATSTKGPTGVDETTAFLYQYGNNNIAKLSCTFGAETNTEATIFGTEGRIVMKKRFHDTKEIELIPNEGEPQVFNFPRETFGYNHEIEEVNDCLRKGKTSSDLWPLSQSLKLIQLLDKTREEAGIVYKTDKS